MKQMKRKERYVARLDEVTIKREGDTAVIDYKEKGVPGTHLRIGPQIAGMSDEEILQRFNDSLRAAGRDGRAFTTRTRGKRLFLRPKSGMTSKGRDLENGVRRVPTLRRLGCPQPGDTASNATVGSSNTKVAATKA